MTADTSAIRDTQRVTPSKLRTIRVPSALWVLAGVVAARRFETTAGMVKRVLAEYLAEHATDEDRERAAELIRDGAT